MAKMTKAQMVKTLKRSASVAMAVVPEGRRRPLPRQSERGNAPFPRQAQAQMAARRIGQMSCKQPGNAWEDRFNHRLFSKMQ